MNGKLKSQLIFLYGLPGLPLAMLGLPLFVYLPSYYSQNLGLSLTAVGFALLSARLLDVITDPLIGLLNDRYPVFRSASWRRKSFIIAGIPLLLVGLNYLLRPEETASAFYLFFWSFVTYLGWTLINIPWLAVGAEISHDYHEKSALASSREVSAVVGTITVISLPVLMSIDSDLTAILHILASLLTFLVPLTLLPLLWKLSPQMFLSKGSKSIKQKLFSKETFEVIKHPAIRKLLPAYFINSVGNALPATLFILFVTYVLQTPDKIGVLLISYFLSAIIGIPFWLYVARRTDKHISWRTALYGSIASFIWVPFIGVGDFQSFLVICVASGFCLGADVVMPASIQADISQHISANNLHDTTTMEVGNSSSDAQGDKPDSTGLLFGVWGLLTKLSLALAVGIAFPLLDMVGLRLGSATVDGTSDLALITLVILYSLIPVLFKFWVIYQMWRFPYGRNYFTSTSSSKLTIQNSQATPTRKENKNVGKHDENYDTENISQPVSLLTHHGRVQ